MTKRLNETLLEGVSRLDISPTMFKEATEHYRAIAELLKANGLDADFFPQGSFSTGTVVRPYSMEDDDAYYDLDMVCLVRDADKETSSPAQLLARVAEIFMNNDVYSGKCRVWPECITIEYSRSESRPGFNLDIVVAVQPSGVENLVYALCGIEQRWAELDIAIAVSRPASWMGSNPRALSEWFGEANAPFAEYDRSRRLATVFRDAKGFYASVEEIPVDMERSALQRAIQIAKRARDLYYAHLKDGYRKPESCMLLVLIAQHAKTLPADSTALDILRSFCEKMLSIKPLVELRLDCALVSKGKLSVKNPVFPEDFLEEWSNRDASKLLAWIRVLGEDLAVNENDLAMSNAAARRTLGDSVFKAVKSMPAVVPSLTSVPQVKPWGSNGL